MARCFFTGSYKDIRSYLDTQRPQDSTYPVLTNTTTIGDTGFRPEEVRANRDFSVTSNYIGPSALLFLRLCRRKAKISRNKIGRMRFPESDYHEPTAWSKPTAKGGGGVNTSYVTNFKNVYKDLLWLLPILAIRVMPNFLILALMGARESYDEPVPAQASWYSLRFIPEGCVFSPQ
ncbi:uncharacterized protein CLUP02_12321 [Colletotrichum lupini]|uniref:Uncharacterized protein n=1 Tax=Colletotrichum lupini TaxID=145971 RepID=A0A9Q8T048_9PEZI|nr:uncharacterized protein CLUP02_12321 [Colletotrichum lupini]UQC86819.1 hypothetical protein CLUP02_12321 [Colletotrichum lupini]